MTWQPIETAPKDGTKILVWAQWDWDGMDGEGCSEPYAVQVAYWERDLLWDGDRFVGQFTSETFKPYSDRAVRPTHWMPLPEPPQ